MLKLYQTFAEETSASMTKMYSTSFSMGIRLLGREIRQDIYNIYGFVRLADEVVDTMKGYDQEVMLNELEAQVYQSISQGISTNPILESFQSTVNKYHIDIELIDQFLNSMKMDLEKVQYTPEKYKEYILGSAEVVGLMCLQVFLNGDKKKYAELKPYAEALGSVFQKINFLRDLSHDYHELDRTYFPGVNFNKLTDQDLEKIYEDIEREFEYSRKGVAQLPQNSRMAVYLITQYYHKLYMKIKHSGAKKILHQRIRIPNYQKLWIFLTSYLSPKSTVR